MSLTTLTTLPNCEILFFFISKFYRTLKNILCMYTYSKKGTNQQLIIIIDLFSTMENE